MNPCAFENVLKETHPPSLSTSASLSVGMICLALDEIVSDGVVEATDWDTIRRGIKLKMSGD